jgi:subtilisin family serine protease
MGVSEGRAETRIGLIDGPVNSGHPDLTDANISGVGTGAHAACAVAGSTACGHGTFVAGMLAARRGADAPSICPGCTLLVRPIFAEGTRADGVVPSARPEELAAAVLDCLDAGAHVVNLSVALTRETVGGQRRLEDALDEAARRGAIVIAAAGNQGAVGSSSLTRHPWVVPVVACDQSGRPTGESNLGRSIGLRGLSAPGAGVTSTGAGGGPAKAGGTSIAAPFVTGAVALLRSLFPKARAAQVRLAVTHTSARRASIVPPLLDAWGAYQVLLKSQT